MDILSTHIQILIGDLSRVLDDGSPSQESAEALMIKAERVHHLMATLVDVVPGMESNLPLIESVISSLSNVISLTAGSHADEYNSYGYSAPRFTSGGRGRPKVEIPRNTLEYLIGNHFSVHRVAYLLQTSVSTVRRRMHDFGLSIRSTYSVISDAQLDTLVRQIQYQYPNCGYHLLKGHLAAMGYRIQENRIRDSLRRVDPVGIMSRWICAIQRTYSVSGPNALWHIDGNHKLIR